MSMNKMNASFAFMEQNYYEVIDLLHHESKTDYDVIITLGPSYFAVGEFLKAYKTLAPLFNPNEAIYKLPNSDREACFPFGAVIYHMLDNDQCVQRMFSNVQKMGCSIYQNPPSLTNLEVVKDTVVRYKGYAKKYCNGTDDYDCFVGLMFLELAEVLTPRLDLEIYDLKKQLLGRIVSSTQNAPFSDLLAQGYTCLSKKYEDLMQKNRQENERLAQKIISGEEKVTPFPDSFWNSLWSKLGNK